MLSAGNASVSSPTESSRLMLWPSVSFVNEVLKSPELDLYASSQTGTANRCYGIVMDGYMGGHNWCNSSPMLKRP